METYNFISISCANILGIMMGIVLLIGNSWRWKRNDRENTLLIFMLILVIMSCLAVLISTEAKIVETMNTPVPQRSGTSLLSRTKPVRARVIFVISMPSSVTTSARAKNRTKSPLSKESIR